MHVPSGVSLIVVAGLFQPPVDRTWQPCWYHPDGSGGLYSSCPDLRRVGIGVAKIEVAENDPEDCKFAWGAFAGIPGLPQTVPRSELFAVVVICFFATIGAWIGIATDSDTARNGVQEQRKVGDNAL